MNATSRIAATTLMTLTLGVGICYAATTTKTTKTTAKKTVTTTKTTTAPKTNTSKLLTPAKLKAKAPEVFSVKFETSKGVFVVEVHRAWSPNGADRFYNLVSNGYYDDVRFFRVIAGFMAQFGINGNPAVNTAWEGSDISDDPVKESNKRGMVSFAMRGPNTRTTQLFINYSDRNAQLDASGFSPFGKVTEGMEVVDSLYSGYGEGAPSGAGPEQGRTQAEGNTYLKASFPKLDYVKTATIVKK